jgi:predicted O-methyltransferase YrrM
MRLKALVGRPVQRVLKAAVRATSSEYRAYCDLFDPVYSARVDWRSGIGEGLATIYGLARTLQPEVVVETGSARGKSTCALSLACRQNGHGRVYAIDPHVPNDWAEFHTDGNNLAFLRQRLEEYGLETWCQIIQATSVEAAKGWARPIDLLFIDCDHTYDGVKADFELFQPFLKPTALVVFHDSMWEYLRDNEYYRTDMGVPRYLAELKEQNYHSVTVPSAPGVTIVQPQRGGFEFVPGAGHTGQAFVS